MLFLPMDKLQLMLKMMYELVASMMFTSKNVCKPGAFSFRYHLTKMAEAVPESVARIWFDICTIVPHLNIIIPRGNQKYWFAVLHLNSYFIITYLWVKNLRVQIKLELSIISIPWNRNNWQLYSNSAPYQNWKRNNGQLYSDSIPSPHLRRSLKNY